MIKNIYYLICGLVIFISSCNSSQNKEKSNETIIIHDTVMVSAIPEGTITYNLPCRIISINPEQKGKAILFLWLHGGVHDKKQHDFFGFNHMDCSCADNLVLSYLKRNNIKAIALFPICHKASMPNCISWKECYNDVKKIIDDLTKLDLIDTSRIYVAGNSDGGVGTWDYAEMHPEMFAAAMPMSCAYPRMIKSIPIYFFNTKSEHDCTSEVNTLNSNGANIKYKYCSNVTHGGDDKECTDELLNDFFNNIKQ